MNCEELVRKLQAFVFDTHGIEVHFGVMDEAVAPHPFNNETTIRAMSRKLDIKQLFDEVVAEVQRDLTLLRKTVSKYGIWYYQVPANGYPNLIRHAKVTA